MLIHGQLIFPTSLPFDGSHIAIHGSSQSQAEYHLSQTGFSIISSGFRSGALDSRANVQPAFFFSVSADTTSIISGSLSADDPGLTGKGVGMEVALTDVDTMEVLFHNNQSSFGVLDASYQLGYMAGTIDNELEGSMTGVLLAGHRYRLFYGTSIYASNSGDPASYIGNFVMRFGESNTNPVVDAGVDQTVECVGPLTP